MEKKQNKFEKFKGNWDPVNSTYKHLLYTNKGKQNIMPGYSKGEGLDAPKDPDVELQKVILRLVNNGYLYGCHKMEFYEKNFLDSKQDQKILVLYHPEHREKFDFEYADQYEWIVPFLQKVYKMSRDKQKIVDSIFIKRKTLFKKYDLDIELYKEICNNANDFSNKLSELNKLAEIPYDILLDFWKTYKKHFKSV